MHGKICAFAIVTVLGSVSIVQADEGEELKNTLHTAAPDYLNKQIKGESDLALIKDQTLKNRLVNFCKTCTEVSKPVSMGGGQIMQKSCSNKQCHTLCPQTSVPDVCKS